MDKLKVFFDKFQNVMEEKVVPVATRIASQKHLSALRDGLTILIPFTVIGNDCKSTCGFRGDETNKLLFSVYDYVEELGY